MKSIKKFRSELKFILITALAAGLGRQLIVEGDKTGGLLGITGAVAGVLIIVFLGGWVFNERRK